MTTRNILFFVATIFLPNVHDGEFLQKSTLAGGVNKLKENKICDMHIQSLVRILSLRDQQVEQHTQRVTSMAFNFARFWGLSKDLALHIRRGALLHDIGKICIPDSILHKDGPLTDKETAIMQMHPIYAYKLLSNVSYLHPVLDIPYCHHEKWDGTGYPRGLKGNQIPFTARMFAIVDVWDALRSDRPYRPAWAIGKTMAYIHDQSDKQFDPEVVKMFEKLLPRLEGCTDSNHMHSVGFPSFDWTSLI